MNGCLYKRSNWPFSPYRYRSLFASLFHPVLLTLACARCYFFFSSSLPHNSYFSTSSKAYACYCIIFGERFHPAKISHSFCFLSAWNQIHGIRFWLINHAIPMVNDIACYPQIWWTASMPLHIWNTGWVCAAQMYIYTCVCLYTMRCDAMRYNMI